MTETPISLTIGVFLLPHEIDHFQRLVHQFHRNIAAVDEELRSLFSIHVHAMLCTSDTLIHWDKSILPENYFLDKFDTLKDQLRDYDRVTFDVHHGDEILGCTSYRRWLTKNTDTDFVTWFDCDMIIGDLYLRNLLYSLQAVEKPNVIITPQIVRIWDMTWDCLVHDDYIDWDHEQYRSQDMLPIVQASDVETRWDGFDLKELDVFKFAGGWGTTFSRGLLESIPIPESFSHYGLEDTFIMICCEMWKRNAVDYETPIQYIMSGCVVGEDYLNRDNGYVAQRLSPIDRRGEFKYITESRWEPELKRFSEILKKRLLEWQS